MKREFLRKAATLLLTGTFILSAFTGCGSSATSKAASSTKSSSTASSDASGEKRTIKVGTSGSPKPYLWQNDDGTLDGYDIAVFNAIEKKLPQYNFEYEVINWEDLFSSADAGHIQVINQHLGINDERREKYLVTDPYYYAEHAVVTKEGSGFKPTKFEELAGHTTETTAGSFNSILYEKWNKEHPDKKINFTYVDSSASNQAYQDVADGKIDFNFFDKISIEEVIKEQGITGVTITPIDNDSIPNDGTGFTFFLLPKGEEQLEKDINTALEALVDDGTLKALSKKYLGGEEFAPTEEQIKANQY